MRVNIESKALSDPRFARLGARLAMNEDEALGRCVRVWMQAYENRSASMKSIDVDAISRAVGFAKAMVDVDLAQPRGKSIRLRGVDERIEFLLVQDAKRAKALEARRRNQKQSPNDIPGERPRGKTSDENAKSDRVSPGTVPGDGPYSLDLDLDLDLDQDQAQAQAQAQALGAARPGPPRARKRKELSSLPEAWAPGATETALALRLGLDLDREVRRFRDNAIAKDHKFKDWGAAFRTWLDRSHDFQSRRPSGPQNNHIGRAEPATDEQHAADAAKGERW